MTKDEFIAKQKSVRHDLTHLGFVPWGIIFSIFVCMLGWSAYLVVLLFKYFGTEAVFPILYQLGFSITVLAGIYFADKFWRRKLRKTNLFCSACHKWLDPAVADSGLCSHCGQKVFDE